MQKLHLQLAALVCAAALPGVASAITVFDYFGPLDEATFGGTGIPNQEVAVAKQIVDGEVEITVALSATQRFFNPALTNDGAGTYFAGAGQNCGVATDPIGCPSASQGALWNFNYFLRVEAVDGSGATPKLTDYQFDLFYDFDPGTDTPKFGLGYIDMTAVIGAGGPPSFDVNATLAEDSQNLLFSAFADTTPPFSIAPGGSFDPNATGEYSFVIEVSRAGGFTAEAVAIDVQVVPVPAAVWLFGSALGLLAWVRRRTA